MLRLMRQNASSWIIKFLLGIIVLAFIFMGVGSYDSSKKGSIASVNGSKITIEEYQESYNQVIDQLRQRFGKNLSEDMLKMFNVKKQAIDRLIDNKLLLNEAEKLNIIVSDDELAKSIKSFKAFQNNGAFDLEQYKKVLRYNALTPERFEYKQRESMILAKLQRIAVDSAKVSEKEAQDWYNWEEATVSINAVLFEPGDYKDIEPNEDEIKAHFDAHQEKYKTKEKRKVRYLKLDPKSYSSKVTVTDDEIKTYYDSHPKEFFSPKTVEARHILKKVAKEDPPETAEKKKQEILDVLKQIKEGADFGEMAKKHSEGPSNKKGGQLGAFKHEDMVKPFADKAFALKEGEVSDPVRTQFGWHLIKVEKINEESQKSLEEAKEIIRKKLTREKSKTLAYDEAVEIYESSFEGDDLVLAAKERQFPIETTDFFTNSTPLKGINNSRKFVQTAFSLAMMEISDILELGNAYYLIQVIEKKDPVVPEFETVKEAVKADLAADLQDKKAAEEANAFLEILKKESSLEAEAESKKLDLISTGYFKRKDSIPNIGYEMEVTKAAFQLSSKNPKPENIIKAKKGYYVIEYKDRKVPDSDKFIEAKEKIITQLIQQKQAAAYTDWVAELKKGSDIKIEKGIVQ